MDSLTTMIKQAAENKADFKSVDKTAAEKDAFTPAVGGEIPPPAGGEMPPPPGGAMPPGGGAMPPPPGGMPAGMPTDPMMGGAPPAGGPPMDPAMMDPAMMGGPAPMDPAAMGMEGPPPEEEEAQPPVNAADADYDGDKKPDVMVPLGPISDFATSIIEATKGKRTADAAQPGAGGPEAGGAPDPASAPMDPAAMAGSIGGAPAEAPMGAMPKLSAMREEVRQAKLGK